MTKKDKADSSKAVRASIKPMQICILGTATTLPYYCHIKDHRELVSYVMNDGDFLRALADGETITIEPKP